MTSLKIIPNFEKKTAKFEGTIAGGERVRVEISDVNKYIGGLNSLRLRAVGSQGETLAQFPFENSGDTWVQEAGKIICELNLNTDKLLEAVPPASRVMVLFVLDDGGNEVLYFKSFCAVDHWPRKVGEEEPVDLGGYADFVKDATESIASAEVAIEKASENAMNASKNAEEAAKNAKEAVATVEKIEKGFDAKADNTALEAEAQRATGVEATLGNAIAAETQRAQEAEAALRGTVDGKVQSVNGKTGEVLLDASDVGALPLVEDANSNKTAVTIGDRKGNVGRNSLANGNGVEASGGYSHAEGYATTAAGGYSHAEGCSTTAAGDYSHAEGFSAYTKEQDIYAFVWNGDGMRPAPYESHGSGTFNISPFGGLEGFYIGEQTLASILTNKADKVANATSGNLAALDENGNLTDSGMTLRDFAVAKSLAPAFVPYNPYEVGDLCTSFDNEENHRGTWLYKCILATDGSQLTMPEIDPTHWALATVEDVLAALRQAVDGKVDVVEGKGLSSNDYTNEDKAKLGTAYTPANPPPPPDLSGYATKVAVEQVQGSVDSVSSAYESVSSALTVINNKADAALPRYQFVDSGVVDGVVTVEPYTDALLNHNGTAFRVEVGEGYTGYIRDCVLAVACDGTTDAPTITWPTNFHPRTDAETDFACASGLNIYWISEYEQGQFVVAGWHETAGGSAV